MAFATNIPSGLLLGDASVVFGTAACGGTWGEVVKLDLTRAADIIEVENGRGGDLAAILAKERFEMDIEVVFPAGKAAPGLGDQVAFPLAGITGNITGGIKVLWASRDARRLSFQAAFWDASGAGAAAAHGAPAAATAFLSPAPASLPYRSPQADTYWYA